ncbi:tetratricopeptide repeat protein [uncultured Haemophilus sp.]|uniref:SirB1 family protein n=1 Tax=uncultured Haemophilus sp. TaxID=237779 RepID=UPI002582BB52|nr:tetratricopeptide repeat protein [uncultured Haemophilus sp.]
MDNIINEILQELESPKITISDEKLQTFLYEEMDRIGGIVDEGVTPRQRSARASALVRKVRPLITANNELDRLHQLLDVIYRQMEFSYRYSNYFNSDNLLLHKVLQTKQGMPVSFAAILLYLAAKCGIPLFAVNFPTQIILRAEISHADGRQETLFINPADGKFLSMDDLEKWLDGEPMAGLLVTPMLIRRAEPFELLERVETLFKMALTKEKKFQEVLEMINFRLIFSPDDPYEIRDRGMIFATMECFQAAYEDLSYFIDQCPDDPSARMIKMDIKQLEQKSKEMVLH